MSLLGLESCIPYALGHPRILGVTALKKIKRKNVCEKNFDERFFEELPRRVVQHITLDEDHDCYGALSNN